MDVQERQLLYFVFYVVEICAFRVVAHGRQHDSKSAGYLSDYDKNTVFTGSWLVVSLLVQS